MFIQDILFCTIGAQRVICNKEPLTDLPMQIIIKSIKITRCQLCNTLMYFLSDCQISLGIEDMTKFNAVSIIRFQTIRKSANINLIRLCYASYQVCFETVDAYKSKGYSPENAVNFACKVS